MFGKPGLPKVIPVVIQAIGWLCIVWSIVNFHSMMFLHLILGVVFILNGLALWRITTSLEKAEVYIAVEMKDPSSKQTFM